MEVVVAVGVVAVIIKLAVQRIVAVVESVMQGDVRHWVVLLRRWTSK